MAISQKEAERLAEQILKPVGVHVNKLVARIKLLEAENRELKAEIETLKTGNQTRDIKIAALERGQDATRTHTRNLESRVAKTENGLKPFRP